MTNASRPDFEAMTLEELTEWKVNKHREIQQLQDEYRESNEAYNKRVEEAHIAEARKQMQVLADKNGRTLEEEAEYWQGRLTENGDPGRWIQSNLVLGKEGRVRIG